MEFALPSDELARRRALRADGDVAVHGLAHAVGDDLAGADEGQVGIAHLRHRLAAAEHEVAVLQARVGETSAERDRMAVLAGSRKRDLAAAREREVFDSEALREAQGALARTRAQLAERIAAVAALRVEATGLRARIAALKAQVAGHDARTRDLSDLVAALDAVSQTARHDADRHLAERAEAEHALREARVRISELEEQLDAQRTHLEALHVARDRTLNAEVGLRAARQTELAILNVARPTAPVDPPLDLLAGLSQAAERLRLRAPAPIEGTAETVEFAAVAQRSIASTAPPAPPPPAVAAPQPEPPVVPGRGALRRLLARLRRRSA